MEVDKGNIRILIFNFYLFIFIFSIKVQIEAFDYKDALQKSLLYFEAQRSGHLPHNQRVTWRGHSGLIDGFEQGVDLVGGYYDAGDHVKFGLPMAFTITMLSWTVIEYGPHIEDVGEYYHALEAIKWGTDYFIKAHTESNVLWAEVGDGATDHYCWQRPEDMTTSRRAYKIDQHHPGSDLAGETSAAMAAASIVFRKSNSQYSNLLLHHARQLFDFADRYRGKYDESVRVVKNYYGSLSSYKDELLWAALWLYRATDSMKYKRYAVQHADEFGGTGWGVAEFSWDMKYAGVQILATKLLGNNKNGDEEGIESRYQSKAEHYICACLNMNNNNTISANVHRTPGGLLFIRQWNNMQYVTNAVFLLTIYADYLHNLNPKRSVHCPSGAVTINQIWSLAKSQVDYILGNNPINMSYLVGFGPRYPTEVHHRGASIISYKVNNGFIGCSQGYDHWYSRKGPNPNVLYGAIVGGPNHMDEFRDQRGNFMQMEACTYNTAPLVGIFAKLHRLENQHFIRCRPTHSSPTLY